MRFKKEDDNTIEITLLIISNMFLLWLFFLFVAIAEKV